MKSSGIGGMAVIEGVMMKNKSEYAVAIRKPDNTIEVKKDVYVGLGERVGIFKLPILRGIASFIDSLSLGMNTLSYSAEFYEDAPGEKKDGGNDSDKDIDKNKNGGKDNIVMGITMTIAIIIAVALFVLLPFYIMELLKGQITSQIARSIVEGVIRLVLFILYVRAITLMQDIKRVYMYHGAEHKAINCVERGYELTVENARKQTKEHKRCGTSFLLYVVLLSIIFFAFINVGQVWLRMVIRILLVPVVAGVAYEFIRLAGRTDNVIMNILSKPGLWLQGLTTTEPDDEMLETAIAAVEAVFDWRGFQSGNVHLNHLHVDDSDDEVIPAGEDEINDSFPKRTSAFEEVLFDEDDEDDEILKALDKFFEMGDDEENDSK
ncbi:MAG: DUF1385 domain-containing protein [Lachnospiraceae bacterium]|nr:DUF1385 domain-containing protein [Lachnospiraceae bacterium]